MAPNLSLNYADGGVNGPVGVGWSVQGISTITRCPSSRQLDQSYRNVVFDKDDKLCLDGQRLIRTNTAGAIDPPPSSENGRLNQLGDAFEVPSGQFREYRTEKDSYSRIRAYGTAPGNCPNPAIVPPPGQTAPLIDPCPHLGPARIVVWTKSGLRYEYGSINKGGTADHSGLIRVQGSNYVAVWAVRRISDVNGNFMEFHYTVRDSVSWGSATGGAARPGKEWNLSEVHYTGKLDPTSFGAAHQPTITHQPTNRVVFSYQDRSDAPLPGHDRSEAYQWNNKNVSVQLLSEINTYVNFPPGAASGRLVKRYQLAYTRSTVSGRSLLSSVKECALVGSPGVLRCLPPTSYTYRETSPPEFASIDVGPMKADQLLDHVNGHAGVLTGDFNGDGRTDVLRYHDDPQNNKIYQSSGAGGFTARAPESLRAHVLSKSDGCYRAMAADFNGDGLTDVLRIRRPDCSGTSNLLLLSRLDGEFEARLMPTGLELQNTNYREDYIRVDCGIVENRAPAGGPDRLAKAQKAPVPVDNYGELPNAVTKTAVPTPPVSLWGECWGVRRTIGHAYYIMDVNADGILDIVTTVVPDLYWPFGTSSGPSPYPSPDEQCAGAPVNTPAMSFHTGPCTRLYVGLASGGFEWRGTNVQEKSLWRQPDTSNWNPNPYWQLPDVADINGDGLSDILSENGRWRSLGDGNFAMSPVLDASQLCALPIDFNGDGRSDCLRPGANASPTPDQTLTLSFGAAASPPLSNFNLTSASNRLFSKDGSNRQTVGAVVEDFDGDGRQDVLRWSQDAWMNGIYLSRGDGTFAGPAQAKLGTIQLQNTEGSRAFILGDFLGDGTIQILRLASNPPASMSSMATVACMSSGCYEPPPPPPPAGVVDTPYNMLLVRTGVGGPADVLETVTTSTGLKSTVLSRRSLTRELDTAGGGYVREVGPPVPTSAGAAIINATPPMHVITATERETASLAPGGGQEKLVTRYRYEGMKAERGGRGMLGFVRMHQQDTSPAGGPMKVVTDYLTQHPYIGVAWQTRTFMQPLGNLSGSPLSHTTNFYCETSATSQAVPASPQAPCVPTSLLTRPYLAKTVEEGRDLSGAALPRVETVNTYNLFGDPLTITVTTRGNLAGQELVYTKLTTNTFCAPNAGTCPDVVGASPNRTDGDNWILGRLSRATVQTTAPNTLLPASAGSAPNATATKGAPPPGTPMAINPAVLQAIINLILED